MSRLGKEAKPPWSAIPVAVKGDVADALGSPVVRAGRVYGGYAPSATFRLRLADGRVAFFKGIWRDSNEFMHRALDLEERVYRELGPLISPWAPAFHAAFKRDDWHVLILEDLGPADVPPWPERKVRSAAEEFAAFHQRNLGREVPPWISRDDWKQFAGIWARLRDEAGAIQRAAALAGARAAEAEAWLNAALPTLLDSSMRIIEAPRPYTLLHEDTRSDNVRVTNGRLRLFDWNWISVGPLEFDVAAFAESIPSEGGPDPEHFVRSYERVVSVRRDVLNWAVAGFAAFFTSAAWRPASAFLPRIRDVQRRQMKACLTWAAQLHDLPEPTWLAAVPD